MQKSYQ